MASRLAVAGGLIATLAICAAAPSPLGRCQLRVLGPCTGAEYEHGGMTWFNARDQSRDRRLPFPFQWLQPHRKTPREEGCLEAQQRQLRLCGSEVEMRFLDRAGGVRIARNTTARTRPVPAAAMRPACERCAECAEGARRPLTSLPGDVVRWPNELACDLGGPAEAAPPPSVWRERGGGRPRPRAELVIAHCTLPLGWVPPAIAELAACGVDVVATFVYSKCGRGVKGLPKGLARVRTLPNVGRCDHTYATHLASNYNSLEDLIIFAKDSSVDGSLAYSRRAAVRFGELARAALARGFGCRARQIVANPELPPRFRNYDTAPRCPLQVCALQRARAARPSGLGGAWRAARTAAAARARCAASPPRRGTCCAARARAARCAPQDVFADVHAGAILRRWYLDEYEPEHAQRLGGGGAPAADDARARERGLGAASAPTLAQGRSDGGGPAGAGAGGNGSSAEDGRPSPPVPFASPVRTIGAWAADVVERARLSRVSPTRARLLAARVVPVCYGGTFAATRGAVRGVEAGFWSALARALSRGDNIEEGHYAERLWGSLLAPLPTAALARRMVRASEGVVRNFTTGPPELLSSPGPHAGMLLGCTCPPAASSAEAEAAPTAEQDGPTAAPAPPGAGEALATLVGAPRKVAAQYSPAVAAGDDEGASAAAAWRQPTPG